MPGLNMLGLLAEPQRHKGRKGNIFRLKMPREMNLLTANL